MTIDMGNIIVDWDSRSMFGESNTPRHLFSEEEDLNN